MVDLVDFQNRPIFFGLQPALTSRTQKKKPQPVDSNKSGLSIVRHTDWASFYHRIYILRAKRQIKAASEVLKKNDTLLILKEKKDPLD
jgi:hypothetical protein